MKCIIRNLEYYFIGIPAWFIHELSHFVTIYLIEITSLIHKGYISNLEITCFRLTTKECRLSISYNTNRYWIAVAVSLSPRIMYILFPIVLFLIGNSIVSIYGLVIMTRRSFDMSYRDKYTMLKNLQAIKQLKNNI